MADAGQVGVFMTPEYLDQFADKVSDMVLAKMSQKEDAVKGKLLDIEQAAAKLNISAEHLRRIARAGEIKFHRRPGGRYGFLIEDINDYIQKL